MIIFKVVCLLLFVCIIGFYIVFLNDCIYQKFLRRKFDSDFYAGMFIIIASIALVIWGKAG